MASNQQTKHKRVEYGRYGYFFIAPFFIVFLLFQFGPLLYTIWMSFMEYYKKGLKEVGPTFNGLKNYSGVIFDKGQLFQTMTFRALGNTIFMWVTNFIPQILLSLLLAAWFTDIKVKLRGQGAYKVIVYMPNIITAASIGVLFYSMLNSAGPITMLLRDAGIISATDW